MKRFIQILLCRSNDAVDPRPNPNKRLGAITRWKNKVKELKNLKTTKGTQQRTETSSTRTSDTSSHPEIDIVNTTDGPQLDDMSVITYESDARSHASLSTASPSPLNKETLKRLLQHPTYDFANPNPTPYNMSPSHNASSINYGGINFHVPDASSEYSA